MKGPDLPDSVTWLRVWDGKTTAGQRVFEGGTKRVGRVREAYQQGLLRVGKRPGLKDKAGAGARLYVGAILGKGEVRRTAKLLQKMCWAHGQ